MDISLVYAKNIDLSIKHSKFRSGKRLSRADIVKLYNFSDEKLYQDAKDPITRKLAPKVIPNDGKQTPFKGHPVFVAQHATATCCRKCFEIWHKVGKDKELSA